MSQDMSQDIDADIVYVVEYRNDKYVGTPDEKSWFTGSDIYGMPDLAEAMQLAADFKAGVRFPRGAGRPVITKTRIMQRVTVGSVILSDDPEPELDPAPVPQEGKPEPMSTGEFVNLVTGGENWNREEG